MLETKVVNSTPVALCLVDACQVPSGCKPRYTANHLKCQQAYAQRLLCARAKDVQHQVHQVPVWGCVQQICLHIVAWQPMPGTVHDLEQLRQRVCKVQHLRSSYGNFKHCLWCLHVAPPQARGGRCVATGGTHAPRNLQEYNDNES